MMNTFESYLKEPYVLDFSQMQSLHGDLLSEIDNDADAIELYDELIDIAIKYAAIRAKWGMLSREEKMDIDVFGDDEDNRYYRKTIGDFGCYIVFVNSICAR